MDNQDIKTVILKVNGAEAQKEMEKLRGRINDLTKAKEDLYKRNNGKITAPEDAKRIAGINKEIEKTQRSIDKMNASAEGMAQTLQNLDAAKPKELQRTLRQLKKMLDSDAMVRGSKEWETVQNAITKVKQELIAVVEEQKNAIDVSSGLSEFGQRWVGLATMIRQAGDYFAGITAAAESFVNDYASMAEAESAVIKYTGLTAEEVGELNQKLQKMDTRTPREQLNALAADAGRLGITSAENIMDFVEAADMINVALGEDLGADAVRNIGKLAQLFGDDEEMGLKAAMIATGSVINDLAQSSSANEGYIMDFTARLAGIGRQAGMTQAQVMGLASIMDQAMINAEEGSTAMSRLMQEIYNAPDKMAKAVGLNSKKFAQLVKEDANEAMLQFAAAVDKLGGMDKISPVLSSLSLTGAGVSKTIATLANNIDKVRAAQEQATTAFADGSSIITEFSAANSTVQAALEKQKKRVHDLRVELGEKLLPVVESGLTVSSNVLSIGAAILAFIKNNVQSIVSLTATIGLLTMAIKFTTISSKAHAAATIISTKAQMLYRASIVASHLAVTLFTKGLAAARAQFGMLNTAMKTNVLGLITVGISAAVVAITNFITKSKSAVKQHEDSLKSINRVNQKMAENTPKEITQIKMLVSVMNSETASIEEKRRAHIALAKIVPGYQKGLENEARLTRANKKAIDEYTSSLLNKAKAQAFMEVYAEEEGKRLRIIADLEAAKDKMRSNEFKLTYDDTYKSQMRVENINTFGAVGSQIVETNNARKELLRQQRELQEGIAAMEKQEAAAAEKLQSIRKVYDKDDTIKKLVVDIITDENKETATDAGSAENQRLKKIEAEANKLRLIEEISYQSGRTGHEAYTKAVLAIEVNRWEKTKALYKQGSTEWLEAEKSRLEASAKLSAYSVREIDIEEQTARLQAQKDFVNGSLRTEEDYQNRLQHIRLDALRKKKELAAQMNPNSKEAMEAAAAYDAAATDDQLARRKEWLSKLAQMEREYNKKTIQEREQDELALLDELVKQHLLSQDKVEEFKAKIKAKYDKERENGKQEDETSPLGGDTDALSGGIIAIGQAIDRLHEKIQSGKADWEDYAAVAVSSLAMVTAITSAASQLMQASQNQEISKINQKYDAEVKAAGKNSKKTKQIEEKRQADIAKVKNKYASKAMAMEMAGAVAQTAVAAINAYASAAKVSWVLGPIAAAAALAAGAIQIATIKKQHDAQSSGYFKGGFTGGHNYTREAGVVHEGEWVANHNTLQNPNLLPVIEMLDYAQRNNRVASLTSADVRNAVAAPQRTAAVLAVGQPPVVVQETARTAESLDRLSDIIDKGIPAYVVIDGPDGLDAKLKRYNKLKHN